MRKAPWYCNLMKLFGWEVWYVTPDELRFRPLNPPEHPAPDTGEDGK